MIPSTSQPIGTIGPVVNSRGSGWVPALVAKISAPGFEVEPKEQEEFFLINDQPIMWRWSLRPTSAGLQTAVVHVAVHWREGFTDKEAVLKQSVYSKSIPIDVKVPIVAFNNPIDVTSILTGIIGAILGWVGTQFLGPFVRQLLRSPGDTGVSAKEDDNKHSP
jgi:hypothetical protein